jgi:hypothetical protein
MGKKIIIIFSIMLLSIMMFGCANDGLKLPDKLELKEEYKNSVSVEFAEVLNKRIIKYTELYNQEDKLKESDLNIFLDLDLANSKTNLNDTERDILSKSSKVFADLISEYDAPTNETRIKLKNDIQIILDYYK